MSKKIVTRLFLGSLAALVGGLVMVGAAAGIAYSSGALVMDGPDVVGLESAPLGWAAGVLALLGVLTLLGAAVGQVAAWILAVVLTAQLEDKAWFILLLVLGLVGLGFVGTVTYLLAGPDAAQPEVGPARSDVLVSPSGTYRPAA